LLRFLMSYAALGRPGCCCAGSPVAVNAAFARCLESPRRFPARALRNPADSAIALFDFSREMWWIAMYEKEAFY
jgi:hypothetical protein